MKNQNGVRTVELRESRSVRWKVNGLGLDLAGATRWEVTLEDADGSTTLYFFFSSVDMQAYLMLEFIANDGHGFRPDAPANWDRTKFLVNEWAQREGVDPLGNEELQQHLWNPLKHMLDTYNPLTPPLGESEEGDPAMEAMHQLLAVTKDAADRAEIEAEMEKRRQYLAENPPQDKTLEAMQALLTVQHSSDPVKNAAALAEIEKEIEKYRANNPSAQIGDEVYPDPEKNE